MTRLRALILVRIGATIRVVPTRVHPVAPSFEGHSADVIADRRREPEAEIVARLEILEDRLGQWQRAERAKPGRRAGQQNNPSGIRILCP